MIQVDDKIIWLRSIQTNNDVLKNPLIALKMAIVLARYVSFEKKKSITMDFLQLIADGEKFKSAKKIRQQENKDGPERKKRREKAGKALKILEENGYINIYRRNGKKNLIELIKI